MKKILLSSIALLSLTAAASAADLPRRAAPPMFAPAIPVFTWTGFYVGVNAGYAWADSNNGDEAVFVPPGALAPGVPAVGGQFVNTFGFGRGGNDDGFTVGGTAGFNWQTGAIVFGVEGDLNWADIGDSNNNGFFGGNIVTFTGPGPAVARTYDVNGGLGSGNIDWFGTLRGRIGVAFDRALIYGTGGFAFASGNDNNGFCGGLAFGGCGGNDDWRGGWTVGGGLEYAFTNNLTAKIEGLYVNLDSGNRGGVVAVPVAGNPNPTVFLATPGRGDDDFFVARVGLNYKFGL
jgi:outer membrane immunogenic protein